MSTKSRAYSLFVLLRNNVIAAGLSYLLTIYLANKLGPAGFGAYSLALLVASVGSIVIAMGTDQTAPLRLASGGERDLLVRDVAVLRAALFGIGAVGLLLWAIATQSPIALYVACLLVPCLNFAFAYEINHRNERYSTIFMVERLAYVFAAFAALQVFGPRLPEVFACLFLVATASIVVQARDFREALRGNRETFFHALRRTLAPVNFALVALAFGLFAYGGFSRLLLERKLGIAALGVYSAGWQFVTIGTLFQNQVQRTWRVELSQAVSAGDSSALERLLRSYFFMSTLPIAAFSAALAALAGPVVALVFRPDYASIADILPTFAAYLVTINLAGLAEILWVAAGKHYVYTAVHIASGLALLAVLAVAPEDVMLRDIAALSVASHTFAVAALLLVWAAVPRRCEPPRVA